MNETFYLILYNIGVSLGSFALILLFYAYRSADGFGFGVWFRQNGIRLVLGAGVLILLSVLIEVSPEFDLILTAIGFNTNASPVALGLSIAMMAVGTISTTKTLDGE